VAPKRKRAAPERNAAPAPQKGSDVAEKTAVPKSGSVAARRKAPAQPRSAPAPARSAPTPARRTGAAPGRGKRGSGPTVLLVAFHYPPEICGGVPRMLSLERHLVMAGCRVIVVTPKRRARRRRSPASRVRVTRPVRRAAPGARKVVAAPAPAQKVPWPTGLRARKRTLAGRVVRVPFQSYYRESREAPAAAPSLLRSLARRWVLVPDVFLPWAMRAAREAEQVAAGEGVDLVVTSSPPDSMHYIGRRLKKRLGCRWLADFCDGWTFEPLREEAELPLRESLERAMEASVVSRADWITAATRPIAADLARRFPAARGKTLWLPPGFERFRWESPDRGAAEEADDAGSEDDPRAGDGDFTLVYTGRFSLSHQRRSPAVFFDGLERAFRADKQFRRAFRLVLAGDFTASERELWRGRPFSRNVEEKGEVSTREARELAAGASMCLLVTAPGCTSVATRKLFDYLSVRRPIFALADENEARRIIAETRSGMCVSPSEPDEVAIGLIQAFRLLRQGRLERAFPCSRSDLYLVESHLRRVFEETILPELAVPAAVRG